MESSVWWNLNQAVRTKGTAWSPGALGSRSAGCAPQPNAGVHGGQQWPLPPLILGAHTGEIINQDPINDSVIIITKENDQHHEESRHPTIKQSQVTDMTFVTKASRRETLSQHDSVQEQSTANFAPDGEQSLP